MRAAGISQDEVFEVFRRCDQFIDIEVPYRASDESWTDAAGRCTLVSDSTPTMPPFLGTCANVSIRDAQALAVAVSGIGIAHATLGDAMKAYEFKRDREANHAMDSMLYMQCLERLLPVKNFRCLAKLGLGSYVFKKLAFCAMEVEK
jgi:2-polyprenyl-6-methoxyphenol hydroxylase-like FAD-dependent oxidoreductase